MAPKGKAGLHTLTARTDGNARCAVCLKELVKNKFIESLSQTNICIIAYAVTHDDDNTALIVISKIANAPTNQLPHNVGVHAGNVLPHVNLKKSHTIFLFKFFKSTLIIIAFISAQMRSQQEDNYIV